MIYHMFPWLSHGSRLSLQPQDGAHLKEDVPLGKIVRQPGFVDGSDSSIDKYPAEDGI
jgi:hypothetical protein